MGMPLAVPGVIQPALVVPGANWLRPGAGRALCGIAGMGGGHIARLPGAVLVGAATRMGIRPPRTD